MGKYLTEELTDDALYNQALWMLCDYFNKGKIPKDKNSHLHGIAIVFAQWAKNIRNSIDEESWQKGYDDCKEDNEIY
jgi:hypothetical protein